MRRNYIPAAGPLLLVFCALSGCASPGVPDAGTRPAVAGTGGSTKPSISQPAVFVVPPRVLAVDLSDAIRPAASGQPVALEAAKDEWASFGLELADLPPGAAGYALKFGPLAGSGPTAGTTIGTDRFEPYQIMPMPVDLNRAGYVRHTGGAVGADRLPRALLPIKGAGGTPVADREVPLSALRDPARPTDPNGRPGGSAAVHLWVDVHVPADAPAGDYAAACDLVAPGGAVVGSVPVRLTVFDFALPRERHLQMLSRLDWDGLVSQYPRDFETVTPRLVSRGNPEYGGTVKTLDGLIRLAQHHRLGVVVPRLQPTVKWPAKIGNAPPEIDWTDFDSVVEPWFRGNCFNDGMCLNYWPLPKPDGLDRFDVQSRLQYWSLAVTHFDQNDWLDKASVSLNRDIAPGRANAQEALDLSAEAALLLQAHKRLKVTVPLEDAQVHLADKVNPNLVNPADAGRLLTSCPGLVSVPPAQGWPEGVAQPDHWLRTDLPGLVPYVGAGGDESDVRLWAFLAFLRQAKFILWGSALPTLTDPTAPANPNELIWFYPGTWFGVDEPVPTVQLKWLRRAQQDFEYLWLAKDRDMINALQMARLITKPVELGQSPDPVYSLMTGTTDRKAWADARRLLVETILVREPGKPANLEKEDRLQIHTLQWARPLERKLLMGRSVTWEWDGVGPAGGGVVGGGKPGNWVRMTLGLDVYNAADVTPNGELAWKAADLPAGWEVRPKPVPVPSLGTYQVRHVGLDGRFDLSQLTAAARRPVGVELTIDGPLAKYVSPLKLSLPVAACEQKEGRFDFDGKLTDWSPSDLAHDGPLVKMLDRPGVQKQDTPFAATSSKVYTGWAAAAFYVAFSLDGVSKVDAGGRNDVAYQSARAWGEDLCEVLVQPVYADNTLGPILHVVCKPNGSNWVERKLNPKLNADPWQAFESTGVRYRAAVSGPQWTGEVAIPWRVLTDPKAGVPTLLRFNFAQHRTATGESASWAGPVDFGRDDAFTGLLVLRGMAGGNVADAVSNDRRGDTPFDR